MANDVSKYLSTLIGHLKVWVREKFLLKGRNQKARKHNVYGLFVIFISFLADRTGLEPATSAVTGRHSNQLNYRSFY